jgi:hypothetical protein
MNASVTTGRPEKANVRPEKQELAKPAPAPVLEPSTPAPARVVETESQTPALVAAPPNPALTHLDAAITGLEKEVEMDKQELTRLEALRRDIAKKQELLAALIKERGKFVGNE